MSKLLTYDTATLSRVLNCNQALVFIGREKDPVKDTSINYRMQAVIMNLETHEMAALDPFLIHNPIGQKNVIYEALFVSLSTVARTLTCAGFEIFYIPRNKNQTIPPSDIRIFDPSQDKPAYHIADIELVDVFSDDIVDMCSELA